MALKLGGAISRFLSSWGSEVALLVLISAVVVVVHLAVPGLVPSGADGGNWLAISKDRSGLEVMSAEVSYLPLFPILLAAALAVASPIPALVFVALLAKTMLVLAVYSAARTLGRAYAVLAALLVGVAGAQMEAFSWGGYAQLLGMAFGIGCVFLFVRYLDTHRLSHLVGAGTLAVATLGTHSLIGGLLPAVVVVAAVHWLWVSVSRRGEWFRALRIGGMIAAPLSLVVLLMFMLASDSGIDPVLNPNALTILDAMKHAVREAPIPWMVVSFLAVWAAFQRGLSRHVGATLSVGTAWAVGGSAFLVVTGEPRGLLVAQVGLVLMAVCGFSEILWWAGSGTRRGVGSFPQAKSRLVQLVGISMVSALVVAGLGSYVDASSWYRVVDRAELMALDRLASANQPQTLVLSARGHHGNPTGWWVEGYAENPTWTGVDLAFLAFPEEKQQAEVANSVFSGHLTDSEMTAVLEGSGAGFLIVDRRGPDSAFLNTDVARSMTVFDSSSELVILDVRGEGRP